MKLQRSSGAPVPTKDTREDVTKFRVQKEQGDWEDR